MAWLCEPYENGIGHDPSGWEATIWVLHAMWEKASPSTPDPVDGPPFWKRLADPGPGWRRLLWQDDLHRSGRRLDVTNPDWPAFWLDGDGESRGPDEGSLDLASWSALVDVLGGAGSPGVDCLAYLDPMAAQEYHQPGPVWSGPLESITTLVTQVGYAFSPTNWWPKDRSWFVWTDYDDWATKVSGSEDLIRAIEAEPALEAIRWSGVNAQGGRSWDERRRATRGEPPRNLP